jgi:hypothetical protein
MKSRDKWGKPILNGREWVDWMNVGASIEREREGKKVNRIKNIIRQKETSIEQSILYVTMTFQEVAMVHVSTLRSVHDEARVDASLRRVILDSMCT